MKLALDIGNTNLKLGVFNFADELLLCLQMHKNEICVERINNVIKNNGVSYIIISSVIDEDSTTALVKSLLPVKKLIKLSSNTKIGFRNNYHDPRTCGTDRIAAVAGAKFIYKEEEILILTAGTCLVFDFIDCKGVYHGGLISPGLHMRFRALADYTEALPLLRPDINYNSLVGSSTNECILSGIQLGLQGELYYLITKYCTSYPSLKRIILTGGDADILEFLLASSFSSLYIKKLPNLTLEGLNGILNLNLNEG